MPDARMARRGKGVYLMEKACELLLALLIVGLMALIIVDVRTELNTLQDKYAKLEQRVFNIEHPNPGLILEKAIGK